jgi:multidrug transporter EmrE-like cation transporter
MIWKLFAIVILRTAADLSFKASVFGIRLSPGSGLGKSILQVLSRPFLWIGLILGAANVVVWSSALQSFDLSYAYPFLSFSFVTIIIGGRVFFNETLDRYKTLGVACITLGSLLLFLQ